jgi:hypothetical protein
VEPLTRGLLPQIPVLSALSSTEFVEPPLPIKNSWPNPPVKKIPGYATGHIEMIVLKLIAACFTVRAVKPYIKCETLNMIY